MQNNQQFENWYYSQKSLVQPDFPMGTEILYSICNDDIQKFNAINAYLQIAYEQGVKDGEKNCKQV
jgi:hypothetical protein